MSDAPTVGPTDDPTLPDAAPIDRSGRPRARRVAGAIALVGVVALAVLGLAAISRPATTVAPTASPSDALPLGDPAGVLLATVPDIERRVALARAGREPFASALAELFADADRFLAEPPRPQEPLDIPGTDGPFVDDTTAAYGLALAYVATGEDRYARHAADILRAWSTTTRTTKHTCVTDGDCQTSLIIGRTAPAFVFAVALIERSDAWTTADRTTFDEWLRTIILPTASARDNNWGDAGTFLRLSASSHLGDAAAFDAAVERWQAMMDLVAADGHIPEEVRRGDQGILYTQEALQYKVASAVIAARHGVDLWSYRGADGGTLPGALDYLARFADPSARWPWDGRADFPTPSPMWELVYARTPLERYQDLVTAGRPFGDDGHSAVRWTTLTSAVELGGGLGAALPTASASTAPTATATTAPTPTITATPASTAAVATPVLDPPSLALVTGRYRDLDRIPIRVDWRAPSTGDVKRYRIERWDDGERKVRRDVDADERTAFTDLAPSRTDLRYRVRVSVRGAGTSDWADTDARLRWIADGSDAVAYGGRWNTAEHPDYQGGSARWSGSRGATATVEFDGREIAWLGPVGTTRGRAQVWLDGQALDTVALTAPSFDARRVLYVARATTSGRHRLEIEVVGTSGRVVAIDGFIVLGP